MMGGGDDNFPTDSDPLGAELYDPRSNQWLVVPDTPVGMAGHSATLLPDGRVLLGGTDAGLLLFHPATDGWSWAQPPLAASGAHTVTVLGDGNVLIVGGQQATWAGSSIHFHTLDRTERFDPASGTWSLAPNLNQPRYLHTATLLDDGRVLVVGGLVNGSRNTSSFVPGAEIFVPDFAICEKNHYILCGP
jgi:N-acetylneuraminic acid mutarotase